MGGVGRPWRDGALGIAARHCSAHQLVAAAHRRYRIAGVKPPVRLAPRLRNGRRRWRGGVGRYLAHLQGDGLELLHHRLDLLLRWARFARPFIDVRWAALLTKRGVERVRHRGVLLTERKQRVERAQALVQRGAAGGGDEEEHQEVIGERSGFHGRP